MLCLPGLPGCAAQFYPEIEDLGKKGYHMMSVIWPAIYSLSEWAKQFDRFLDSVKVSKVHLVGDGLGAYLAQYYVQYDRQFKTQYVLFAFLKFSRLVISLIGGSVVV